MLPRKEKSVNEPTMVAVDLAKIVFEVPVATRAGQARLRQRLSRGAQWLSETPTSRRDRWLPDTVNPPQAAQRTTSMTIRERPTRGVSR